MSKLPYARWNSVLFGILWAATAGFSAEATLPVPTDATQRAYLGLAAEARAFTLDDVKARWLVVDVFDMYCHICQQSAPATRRLYAELSKLPKSATKDQIRFLGVGLGNSPLEAATFQRRFKLPFPVVSDRPKHLGRDFTKLRPPTLLVLRQTDHGHEVFLEHQGLLRKRDVKEIVTKIQSAMTTASRPNPPAVPPS